MIDGGRKGCWCILTITAIVLINPLGAKVAKMQQYKTFSEENGHTLCDLPFESNASDNNSESGLFIKSQNIAQSLNITISDQSDSMVAKSFYR